MAVPTRAQIATAISTITTALKPTAKGRSSVKPLLRELTERLKVAQAEADGEAVPGTYTAGMWTLVDGEEETVLYITLVSKGVSGYKTVTKHQYKVDSGSWVDFPVESDGRYAITGLTEDTEYDVVIRAVNATGNGADSDLKSATPTDGS